MVRIQIVYVLKDVPIARTRETDFSAYEIGTFGVAYLFVIRILSKHTYSQSLESLSDQ